MKKILLSVVLTGVAIVAFGQGQVQFRNYITTVSPAINAPITLADGTTRLDGTNPLWRAALIGGPTTATAANVGAGVVGTLSMMYNPVNTTLTWVNFRTGTTPPIAAGYINNSAGVPRVVPGADWGSQALVQMVAWQGDYNTWADAFAAWQGGAANVLIGASNPLTLTLPASSTSPNLTYLTGLSSFSIIAVPEPTTFALAGLGAAALLIFRRRN